MIEKPSGYPKMTSEKYARQKEQTCTRSYCMHLYRLVHWGYLSAPKITDAVTPPPRSEGG